MRIAVWHNLPSGGGKRALHDHLQGLHARGHEIEIWSPSHADRDFLPLAPFGREHVVDLTWPPPPSLRERLRLTTPIEEKLAAMDANCRVCAAEIEAGGFDVLFANSCEFFRTSSIGQHTALPSVLYLQEPFRWLYEAMPDLCWTAPAPGAARDPRRWREAIFEHRRIWGLRVQAREEVAYARAFDRILVNSFFSRESVLRAYGLDSEVCYLGADTHRFVDEGRAREPFVLGLGAFTQEKGLELAIRSVAQIAQPRPRLVWIGNFAVPAYLEQMQALSTTLGVAFEPKVRVADEVIVDHLNRASAMIYAPRLEPFGLAPIEAGACGLPVVAVAEGGVRETVIDGITGLVVEHRPEAIGAALSRLFTDTALHAELRTNARRNAEAKWSQDAATDRIEAKLQEAARRGRRAA